MKKSQNGFVLISVLLITTISTIYAFNEIKGNQLQERIGGNQQKEMNARLLSEEGVFDSFKYIKADAKAGTSASVIASNLSAGVYTYSDGVTIAEVGYSNDVYTFTSQGSIDGAAAFMKASIKAKSSNPSSAAKSAIAGCDGVTIKNSGHINSYDSKMNPIYSDQIATNDATVKTILDNKDIALGGGMHLGGNVEATGAVHAPSGNSPGDVNINGNIAANKNILLNSGEVTGNLNSGQSIDLKYTNVEGNVDAVDGFTHKSGASVGGTLDYGGVYEVPDNGNYSGPITAKAAANQGNQNIPNIASDECDILSVATKMEPVEAPSSIITSMTAAHSTTQEALTFRQDAIQVYDNTSTSSKSFVDAQSLKIPMLNEDDNIPVHVVQDLNVNNKTITISGNVVILVKGDFISLDENNGSGGNGGSFILDTDTPSTLTILVEGQTLIGGSSEIFKDQGVVEVDGKVKPPFSIYSSFDSTKEGNTGKDAVTISGSVDAYAKIYAPLASVTTASGGSLRGAIRGKTVTATGNGGIYFDEQLLNVKEVPPSSGEKAKYLSAFYYYP